MNRNLLLIRHGESEAPVGTFIGHTDSPLSDTGIRQAEALRPLISTFEPESIFTSPLMRARETMNYACGSASSSGIFENGLVELDFGRWEGKTFEQVNQSSSSLVSSWVNSESSFSFPGGESVPDFHHRVAQTIDELLTHPQQSFALFTHSGVIRSALCHLLKLPTEKHWAFDIHCGKAAAIRVRESHCRLVAFNIRSSKDLSWEN